MLSYELKKLVQKAFDKKNNADDGEEARKWAIVRTELEKIYGYVRSIELDANSAEVSNAS